MYLYRQRFVKLMMLTVTAGVQTEASRQLLKMTSVQVTC